MMDSVSGKKLGVFSPVFQIRHQFFRGKPVGGRNFFKKRRLADTDDIGLVERKRIDVLKTLRMLELVRGSNTARSLPSGIKGFDGADGLANRRRMMRESSITVIPFFCLGFLAPLNPLESFQRSG
jgi:hypothetical protein